MRRLIVTALIAMLATPAFAADQPKTEDQKTFYAIGLLVSRQLSSLSPTPEELEYIKQGLTDAGTGKKPLVDLSTYNEKIQELAKARRKAQGEKLASVGKEFLDKASKEKGAVKTESGMVFLSMQDGTGAAPTVTDTVKVNYRGSLTDGKEFDSSFKRGMPAEFKLNSVIKCWTEGLQKMKAGGKAKLVCPPALAYGESGAGELILPNSTLVFEVELLEVKK